MLPGHRRAGAYLLCILAGATGDQAAPNLSFVEAGAERGLTVVTFASPPPRDFIIDSIGTGTALFDYDNDGDLDLFQLQSSSLAGFPTGAAPTDHLYRNTGDGAFEDVTRAAGLGDSGWGFGCAVGDYDNDGDPDLYVTTWGKNRLYRNEGDGTFKNVGSEAGVADERWGASAAFFDYDHDGLLDLYVTNYVDFDPQKIPGRDDPEHPCAFRGIPVFCGPMGLLAAADILYRNNGDGTFTDVSAVSGVADNPPSYGLGVATGDVDNDGDADIFVANDSSPNFLYRNEGGGKFVEDALFAGVAFGGDGRAQAGMGCDLGDPDGDGDLDVFVNNFSHDYSTLYQNDGTGTFEDVTLRTGMLGPMVPFLSWGVQFEDLDNDGDEDLFISNGHVYPEVTDAQIGTPFLQRCVVFLNDGKGVFSELPPDLGMDKESAYRGAAFGDVDGDGDIDVAVARMFEPMALFINQLTPGNHWITIRLVGTRSNRDAVGARVWVEAGGRKRLLERTGGGSFESASDPRLHTGLGPATKADSIEIRWPGGATEKHLAVPADQVVTYVEP